MLLTITTSHQPATDLGFLLHKNPSRSQTFELSFGRAHVFYPEASRERCTAALLLDIDPIGLVRNRQATGQGAPSLAHYINDRAYAASSFLSVAISLVYGTALGGRSKDRPELAESALPLQAMVTPVPCRGGEGLLRRLFEPLGYSVAIESRPLDARFPDWGPGVCTVHLSGTLRLRDLLTHVYVLVPVIDDEKHYWVGEDEVAKLLRHGEPWLSSHPQRELIVNRYLRRKRGLVTDALTRLMEEDQPESPDEAGEAHLEEEEAIERPMSLHRQRLDAVMAALHEAHCQSVIDLGCGEGRLLEALVREPRLTRITGLDVSHRALEIAAQRLHLDSLPERQRERLSLLHGALTYRDRRIEGYEAACVIEVIEHLDTARLASFERVLFEFAHPNTVVLTTPNVEYNARFPTLPAGQLRHKDHRFEWTRAELQRWAARISERFGYRTELRPVGPEDPEAGPPTQMTVFSRE
jgi:3' terminal RNA ribose 2'-O-methyltransferase Hen1